MAGGAIDIRSQDMMAHRGVTLQFTPGSCGTRI
jgi:hypothetical protein